MIKPTLHLLLLLTISLFLVACEEDKPKLQQGQNTPTFALENVAGGTLNYPTDLKGKIVTIRFWADWCPFCKTEMQDMEPVYQNYKDRGLVILAVNVRQDKATAEAFLSKLNISYDALLDEQGEVARAYGVAGLPTTFVINREGKLHTKIFGESTPGVFEKIIKELL